MCVCVRGGGRDHKNINSSNDNRWRWVWGCGSLQIADLATKRGTTESSHYQYDSTTKLGARCGYLIHDRLFKGAHEGWRSAGTASQQVATRQVHKMALVKETIQRRIRTFLHGISLTMKLIFVSKKGQLKGKNEPGNFEASTWKTLQCIKSHPKKIGGGGLTLKSAVSKVSSQTAGRGEEHLIRWMTYSASSSLEKTSQTPSQASTRAWSSSFTRGMTVTSGSGETSCSAAGLPMTCL